MNVTVGKHDLLPSVFTTALGKDTSLCTLALPSPLARTLAKGEDLPSAFTKALVKVRGFAECLTVMALGKASITITWPSSFFFRETSQHSAKALQSARQKALDKQLFAVSFYVVSCLPRAAHNKAFAVCFIGSVECSRHSANGLYPVVGTTRNQD